MELASSIDIDGPAPCSMYRAMEGFERMLVLWSTEKPPKYSVVCAERAWKRLLRRRQTHVSPSALNAVHLKDNFRRRCDS